MLLPVLATMLHFSPAEVAKCQDASSGTEAPAGDDACHCDVRQRKNTLRSAVETGAAAERVVEPLRRRVLCAQGTAALQMTVCSVPSAAGSAGRRTVVEPLNSEQMRNGS
jgi:hypothetical protein